MKKRASVQKLLRCLPETLCRTDKAQIKAPLVTSDVPRGINTRCTLDLLDPGDECLLGQRGTRGYSSSIQPVFSTGECLIGKPDPIDW